MSTATEIHEAAVDALRPADKRTIGEWSAENIVVGSWSPWPGPFDPSLTPWILEPLRVLGLPGPRRLTIFGPAAGGKSTIGEVFSAWAVDNAPGLTAWFAHTDEMAKEFAETRLQRMFAQCPRVASWFATMQRHAKRTQAIHFPHMSFLVQAANETNAQSKHIRHLIMDETWQYAPGMLAQLHKRTTRFAHNRTILELSTGSLEGDETDQAWQQGTRQLWQIVCPHCGRSHAPRWSFGRADTPGGVKWDVAAKRADGSWDLRKVAESTAYECPLCVQRIPANASNAIAVNRGGSYSAPSTDAMPRHWSFRWNCIASDFAQLGTIAVEFLQAQAALKRGTTILLQEFRQKKEAEAWADEPPEIRVADIVSDYALGAEIPEGWIVILTVDCQQSHFWALVRAFSPTGESRLVNCARLESWDSIRAYQESHSIPDDCVVVDSGHQTDAVYTACCRWGWIAIKGEKVPGGYTVTDKDGRRSRVMARASADINGRPVEYFPMQLAAGSVRRSCNMVLVSDEMSSEVLARARAGQLDGWTMAKDSPDFYRAQMAAMVQVQKENRITGKRETIWKEIGKAGNHLWDCERYAIAAAFIAGNFSTTDKPNDNDNADDQQQ